MGGIWEGIGRDFSDLNDVPGVARAVVRLVLAVLLGGLLGYERERLGRPAGLRTHMLVALGSAFYVLAPERAGMDLRDLSRVIQGLLTGIGFLGAGAILKSDETLQVKGLTTAAGLWLTAAVGMAAGMGKLASAVLVTALALFILAGLRRLERRIEARRGGRGDDS